MAPLHLGLSVLLNNIALAVFHQEVESTSFEI